MTYFDIFSYFLTGSELNLSTVFLLKGNDLFMELQTQKPAGQLTWQFKKIRILRHNPKGDTQNFYGTRAEFSTNNYSLQIKNVGLNDSGLYEALDISGQKDEVIAGYHVTVQGMFTETEYRHSIQAVHLFVF